MIPERRSWQKPTKLNKRLVQTVLTSANKLLSDMFEAAGMMMSGTHNLKIV